jgi:hypothetical protein
MIFPPGEAVMIEKPFVTSLDRARLPNYCLNCLEWTDVPVPCSGCAEVRDNLLKTWNGMAA